MTDQREAFEKWAKKHLFWPLDHSPNYSWPETERAWAAWQACAAVHSGQIARLQRELEVARAALAQCRESRDRILMAAMYPSKQPADVERARKDPE